MKILMLSDLYRPFVGGIERHVQLLSQELSKRGHEVVICTMRQRDLPIYEEENEVRIYRLEGLFQIIPFLFRDATKKTHPPAQDWLISREVARIIEREGPDIIHAHDWMVYSAFPLKKSFKIPLVYTLHDYRLFCPKILLVKDNAICGRSSFRDCIPCMRNPSGLPRALAAYYGVTVNKNRLSHVDKFIAVSDFVKELYEEHLGLSDIEIVTIPIFHDPNTDKSEEKRSGSLPDDFILFVGQLMPHKGVEVLIEAYRKLNTKTKLLIIGIEHLGYSYYGTENVLIIKKAPHPAVMGAMSKCRFLVVPSVCPESAATVVREAMSQRKAVIASNSGGLSEAVVDGETGILVPPGDVHKLAEAISYLLKRPDVASRMGGNGYKRFMENYTPAVVIPKIIQVYNCLL